jgi:hypothetical protein
VIAVTGSVAGFGAAALFDTSQRTHENIQLASLTLLFGALLGGVIKLLLDDVQRARERRAEQARFVAKMLDDLKSVYDRVERTRILLPAHRSALTYGKEMRDLIDARVQLLNVVRATDSETSGIGEVVHDLRRAVRAMERYLEGLTDEFQDKYKGISDKQRIQEARVTGRLKALEKDPGAPDPYEEIADGNEAWKEITERLQAVSAFMEDRGSETEAPLSEGQPILLETPHPYTKEFVDPLDLASWLLRSELKKPGKTQRAKIPKKPKNLDGIANRLAEAERAEEAGGGTGDPPGKGV